MSFTILYTFTLFVEGFQLLSLHCKGLEDMHDSHMMHCTYMTILCLINNSLYTVCHKLFAQTKKTYLTDVMSVLLYFVLSCRQLRLHV